MIVAAATTATAYQTNLLVPALTGGPFFGWLPPAPGVASAAAASAAVGSRVTRKAVPSGMILFSPATLNSSEPRVLFTSNSRELITLTWPTVGSSVLARMVALAKRSVKALALAVEKVAVPEMSVAAGLESSLDRMAPLELASRNRAAPERICTLPSASVVSLSPPNTVLPTEAGATPTLARSANTTIPSCEAGVGADHKGVASIAIDIVAAKIPRTRPIRTPKYPT
jgi:hypothetical protein